MWETYGGGLLVFCRSAGAALSRMSEGEDWLGMDAGELQAGSEEVGGLEAVEPGEGEHAKPLIHALEALLVRQTRPLYPFCLRTLSPARQPVPLALAWT
eukprot:COSAG02_NODE_7126_length_3169_cov_3.882736_1_plen_99_part_00